MITVIILAAGAAKRMGTPKQLLRIAGQAMIWWVARAACTNSNVYEVVVVTGALHDEIARVLADLPVKLVRNAAWATGQSSSVRAGVAAIQHDGAVLFMLADQPLITSAIIDQIIAEYRKTKSTIILPVYHERRGNPVLFDLRRWRKTLLEVQGDQGARQIILENAQEIAQVALISDEIFLDVDTPEDYQLMLEKWAKTSEV